MAFTVGTPYAGSVPNPVYTTRVIPTIFSGLLVEKFYAASVLAAIANTRYEGEIRQKGDTVKIRTVPTITINDYETGMDLNTIVQRPSSDVVELTIDKGKVFNMVLDDVDSVQSDLDLLDIWAEAAAESMKVAVDAQVLTSLSSTTDLNSSNYGVTAGAISGSINLGTGGLPRTVVSTDVVRFILDCGQVLDEQNIPETGRWMVVPAWMNTLIKDSDLKNASLAGDGTSILRNGRLGMIDRFTLYLSNNLPDVGGSAGETPIFFGTNAALTFAAQLTKSETLRSERTFGTLLRGLEVHGYKVVNGVAMGRAVVDQGAY